MTPLLQVTCPYSFSSLSLHHPLQVTAVAPCSVTTSMRESPGHTVGMQAISPDFCLDLGLMLQVASSPALSPSPSPAAPNRSAWMDPDLINLSPCLGLLMYPITSLQPYPWWSQPPRTVPVGEGTPRMEVAPGSSLH